MGRKRTGKDFTMFQVCMKSICKVLGDHHICFWSVLSGSSPRWGEISIPAWRPSTRWSASCPKNSVFPYRRIILPSFTPDRLSCTQYRTTDSPFKLSFPDYWSWSNRVPIPLGGGKEADPPDTIVPLYSCPLADISDWMYPPSAFPPALSPFTNIFFPVLIHQTATRYSIHHHIRSTEYSKTWKRRNK